MVPKKRVGRSAKQATPASQGCKPEPSCMGKREGGLEVMEVLLDISRWLQSTKAYIASQQEIERVHHTRVTIKLSRAEGSRRSSYLPTTSLTQDAAAEVSEAG